MPTPFGGENRALPFELRSALVVSDEVPEASAGSTLPPFPEDPDERITVLHRWSLNEFVAMASCVDVGSDIAFGDQSVLMWWIWATSIMADLCDEVAQCLIDENPAIVDALANLIQNNATIRNAINAANAENGGSTPGMPITENQALQDLLPENVKVDDECDLDALWGACLYLVQSANRAITDVFEQLEATSNTIEAMAIAAETIPAAGNYVSAAAQFADQLAENIAEGYAGAYTEEYEQQLACLLFCLAKQNCSLDLETVLDEIGARLDFFETLADFGVLMTQVGAGTWSGDSIADVAFWTYFAALRFGQEFGSTIGIRPLTVLMSLGADQLASDNWSVLCACEFDWEYLLDLTTSADTGIATIPFGTFTPGVGVVGALQGDGTNLAQLQISVADWGDAQLTEVRFRANATSASSGAFRGFIYVTGGSPVFHNNGGADSGDYQMTDGSPEVTPDDTFIHVSNLSGSYGVNTVTQYRLRGTGTNPFA